MVSNVPRATPGAFNATQFVQVGMAGPMSPGASGFTREGKLDSDRPTPRGLPSACSAVHAEPLPMSMDEARRRGWDEIDVVFVTGDAYIDHPSFAMAILGRVLEASGFRVGIIAQPDWHTCEPWKTFGRPRLFFAISAGNMDSMINHYTANRKVRNDDAYSPGGCIGLRPDRATLAYCQRAREAYRGVPIIAGGVEASLRRLAHYDYWSDTVRRSILLDSKADLVAFGMGESVILEVAQRLASGESITDLRNLRGVAYALGAGESEQLHSHAATKPRNDEGAEAGHEEQNRDREGAELRSDEATKRRSDEDFLSGRHKGSQSTVDNRQSTITNLPDCQIAKSATTQSASKFTHADFVFLPSFEAVKSDRFAFAEATRLIHVETNPYNARPLVQWHDRQAVVCNPPRLPESKEAMDFFYDLPYTRKPHPKYKEPIPAYQVVKDSVTIMRGCFGGCTYCSITTHQGRIIQSRSKESILREVAGMGRRDDFKGVISDLGGPTANMYEMRCVRPEIEAICRRLSCVHPKLCPLLGTDHGALIDVMRGARQQKGVRKVLIASGVRMDLAQLSPEYMQELTAHHVGGHLKVAPEHTDEATLTAMKRPTVSNFKRFADEFREESRRAGKEQYLVPYFISAHPGGDLKSMIELAVFLKENGYKPEQVQDFIPAPFDIAACMFHTGLDPMTSKPVYVAKHLRDRKMQRALMQFFKPENYFAVRKALVQAGRTDLIGDGCHALIPAHPPKEAIEERRRRAARDARGPSRPPDADAGGDYVHSRRRMPGAGYRPGRKSVSRRTNRDTA